MLIRVHQAETGDVIEIPVKRMATVEIAVRPRARQRRARRVEGPVLQRHGASRYGAARRWSELRTAANED